MVWGYSHIFLHVENAVLIVTNFGAHILVRKSLNRAQSLAYALPVLGTAFLLGSLSILYGVYAKHFGLALSTIASVLLISRLFDAVTDPIIGYLSDRCHARWGSRKPFVICGGLLFVLSSYFLFVPIDSSILGTSNNVSGAYFLFWFLAFYLSYTLFEIPHLAWASELANDSREKNTIYGWRALSIFLGSLLFFAVPLLPLFETNAFTPQTMKWSVLGVGCLMLPTLIVCVIRVPNGSTGHATNHKNQSYQKKEKLRDLLPSILGNTPLLWFLAAFFCTGTGVGMWFTVVFLFVDSFLGWGQHFALIYVVSYGVGALSIGIWPSLANRWSKQGVWGLAMSLIVIGIIGTGLLSPSEQTRLPLILSMTLIYSGWAAWTVMAPSLLADIIDFGIWKFGRDRAGTYFALYALMSKSSFAVGGAVGLAIAGWYGFDATATSHKEEAEFGLRMAMAWLPTPLVLLSIIFMSLVPLNARRNAIIDRCLDSKRTRKSTLKT